MASDIVLSSALRTNLLSLQNTQNLIDRTQLRLSTGRKVNSALDSPLNFFASQALSNRATDLSRLLDGIGQSISTVEQANVGVEALTNMVEQAQATATTALEQAQGAAGNIRITGSEDLRNISDLVADTSIANGDELIISVSDPTDNSVTTATVAIGAGDSINDLISNINDSAINASEEVIRAELSSNGQFQIEVLNGGNLDVRTNTGATDGRNLAQALGIDSFGSVVDDADTTDSFRIARVADSGLALNLFDDANGSDPADRSSVLTTLRNSDGDLVFDDGGTTSTFVFQVNGDNSLQSASIDLDAGDTLQDLIDKINNDPASDIRNLVRAEFNETTGEVRLVATDSSVNSIDIVTAATASVNNTGFGPDIGPGEVRRLTFGGGAGQLAQLQEDFDVILEQIDSLVEDSNYRGVNLLNGDTLETFFNEDRSNSLETEGQNLTSSGLGIQSANFASAEAAESVLTNVRNALSTVRNFGSTLANSLSIIQARQSFTERTVDNLNTGADKLTLADQNEEGANLLALQTRQQLGVTSLSLASQSQQAVLRLF